MRERERRRREQAQEEAESEVVDREFVCDSDCDAFYEHVADAMRDSIDTNTEALKRRWERFLEAAGEMGMPELVPERKV